MTDINLTLDAQERTYLEDLVRADLQDTRVEERRSMTPSFHDDLQRREAMIRGLLEKIRARR